MAKQQVTTAQIATTSPAWTTFTPTFNLQGTGPSWGNATFIGAYTQIGKTVMFWAQFTLGTTTNFTGLTAITMNLPIAGKASVPSMIIGDAFFMTGYQLGRIFYNSGSNFITIWAEVTSGAYNGAADITGTIPHTWAATHYAIVKGSYEAA